MQPIVVMYVPRLSCLPQEIQYIIKANQTKQNRTESTVDHNRTPSRSRHTWVSVPNATGNISARSVITSLHMSHGDARTAIIATLPPGTTGNEKG